MSAPTHAGEMTMWQRPENKQNPLKMWLITIVCCVVAFAAGLIILSALL